MAKDIWKRKPEKMLSTEGRSWLAALQKEWNELQEKAEKWEQYAIYDNDKEEEILVKDLITAYEKLEAVKNWHKAQLGRQVDPQDIRELGEILEAEG